MAFCQYHLSHKFPVVGIPRLHCGYSSIMELYGQLHIEVRKLCMRKVFIPRSKLPSTLWGCKATVQIYSQVYVPRFISTIFQAEKPLNHISIECKREKKLELRTNDWTVPWHHLRKGNSELYLRRKGGKDEETRSYGTIEAKITVYCFRFPGQCLQNPRMC